MPKIIVTCSCRDMPKFAKDSFALLYKEETPPILKTDDEIRAFMEGQPEGEFKERLKALARSKQKFAYLFEYDNGTITTLINLKTGAKIQ